MQHLGDQIFYRSMRELQSTIRYIRMSEKMKKNLVTPSGEHSRPVHSSNSRAQAEAGSESDVLLEELQHFDQKRSEKEQKSQAGIFSRLRRRLSLPSLPDRELPTRWTSPVSAAHIDTAEVARDNLIITQDKRMPHYQCVPLPPGSIPTEFMEIAEEGNQPGLDPRSRNIDEANLTRNRIENIQQDAANGPNDQRNERSMSSKV